MRGRGVLALLLALLVGVLFTSPLWADQAADDEQPAAPAHPAKTPPGARLPPAVPGPPPQPRHTAIYYIFGFGAPTGIAGLEVTHRFGELPFELAAGVGVGFAAEGSEKSAPLGHVLQWSVMPRLRLGGESHAATFGVGISGGNYGNFPIFGADDGESSTTGYPVEYFLWGNIEIGGEHHWAGFAFRYFLGFANGCTASACDRLGVDTFPYLGTGLGYTF